MTIELKDMTATMVMAAMDKQQPNWWIQWADQRDLQDATSVKPEQQEEFYKYRLRERVMLVMRSAYWITMKGPQ